MKVGQITGHHPPARTFGQTTELVSNDVFLGLEIELEKCSSLDSTAYKEFMDTGLWNVTDDHSLRDGGREFIMCERGTGQPLMGADVIRALDAFDKLMQVQVKKGKPPSISSRTSIHVHIDGRDLEVEDLKRFVLLYYTFEETLFRWVGNNRRSSQYCRAAIDHSDVVYRAARLLSSATNKSVDLAQGNKYDSLNFLSLQNIGTLEIRMMQATTDVALIKEWINLLLLIRAAAKDETLEIDQFPELASINGMEDFLTMIFRNHSQQLLEHVHGMDILRGVRLAQEILVLSNAFKKGAKVDKYFSNMEEDLTFVKRFEDNITG